MPVPPFSIGAPSVRAAGDPSLCWGTSWWSQTAPCPAALTPSLHIDYSTGPGFLQAQHLRLRPTPPLLSESAGLVCFQHQFQLAISTTLHSRPPLLSPLLCSPSLPRCRHTSRQQLAQLPCPAASPLFCPLSTAVLLQALPRLTSSDELYLPLHNRQHEHWPNSS